MPDYTLRDLSVRSSFALAAVLTGAFGAVVSSARVPAQQPGWAPTRHLAIEYASGWFPGQSLPQQRAHMLATDEARGVIVSFGCHDPLAVPADTWEWGGSLWTPRDPARMPSYRRYALFVNDPVRQRLVMFGGEDATANAETWEWDGATWTLRTLPQSPSPRASCGGAYDPVRGRVVLFGGIVNGAALGDTWEYDGTTWLQRSPATSPGALCLHAMTWDEARQRVLLHGGRTAAVTVANQTWEWDGTNWSLRGSGPALLEHALVWDRQRQRAVSLGILPSDQPATFEWDGTSWSPPATALPFTVLPVRLPVATDPATGAAVAFADGKQWRWTGTGWVLHAVVDRTPRGDPNLQACTDTLRNRVVVNSAREGTFEWDGSAWSLTPLTPGISRSAVAFDASRARTVHFGGSQLGSLSNAVHEWDGASWTLVPALTAPQGRYDPVLAYDAARQRTVLFGGIGPFTPQFVLTVYGDTWTWNGQTWTAHGGLGPSARFWHALAYDPVRQVVVLFGGKAAANPMFADTWEWNGSTWTQRFPPAAPSARISHAMEWDPSLGEVVLFGGADASGYRNDAWSWNGTTWTPQPLTSPPSPRAGAALTFDPVRQRLLLQGGYVCPTSTCVPRLDGAWLLPAATAPQAADVGAGCSAGTPPRLHTGTPYLGHRDFALEVLAAQPNAPCFVGFATAMQAQPIGPCTLYLQGGAFVLLGGVTNQFGAARLPLAIPMQTSLAGADLVAQAIVVAPNGVLLGFDLSAARTLRLGD
jgi:hypothetical protein